MIAGWYELVDGLRDLPGRMLAKLPEEQRRDPQIQQEIGRLALAALASSAIDALGSDGDHPAFVAQINQTLNFDTAGYARGVIQGRWAECDSQPVPTVRKVALEHVRQSLPADTSLVSPDQREQRIRDRRAALQQKPLW